MRETGWTPDAEIPGFRLVELLGRGAFSDVFLGEREGKFYAVKVMRAVKGSEVEVSARLRREAAILARLSHPGVPRVYELNTDAPRPYLVMERIVGSTLTQAISEHRVNEAFCLRLGETLGQILSDIHARGWVHRDLKPDNVVIAADGSPRIIDFGTALEQQTALADGPMEGTMAYCSPEQLGALKLPIDARSDLYSLGVMLFECLTSALPPVTRAGTDRAPEKPPRPDAVNTRISAPFSDVVQRLLEKDPSDRFPTAETLQRALAKLRGENEPRKEPRPHTFQTASVLPSHLSLLGELEADARRSAIGTGAAIVLEGPAGFGKSRLLDEFFARSEVAACWSARGRCIAGDPTPLAPIRTALERVLKPLAAEDAPGGEAFRTAVIEAAEHDPAGLVTLSPTLGTLLGMDPGADGPLQDRDRFFESAVQFWVNLSKIRPLILAVDDFQFVDEASAFFLQRLVPWLPESRLLLLLTARPSEKTDAWLLRTADDKVRRVAVPPLAFDDAQALVRNYLGSDQVAPEVVEEIFRRSEGSVFVAQEHLRTFVEAGVTVFHWGTWTFRREALDSLPLSSDALEIVLQRVAKLNPHVHRALCAAALCESGFTVFLVDAMCAAAGQAESLFREPEQLGLINRSVEGRFVFVHEHVREALSKRLSDGDRALFHQRASAHYAQSSPVTDVAALDWARHALAAQSLTTPEETLKAVRRAAEGAQRLFASQRSFELYREAAALADRAQIPLDSDFFANWASVAKHRGMLRQGLDALNRALETEKDPQRRTDLRMRLVHQHMASWHLDDGWREVAACFAELGMSRPGTSALEWGKTLAMWLVTPFVRWLPRAKGKDHDRKALLADLYGLTAFVGYFHANLSAIFQSVLRALFWASQLKPCREQVEAYCLFAQTFGLSNMPRISFWFVEKAKRSAAQTKSVALVGKAAAWEAGALHWAGRTVENERAMTDVLERYRAHLRTEDWIICAGDLGCNWMLRGLAVPARRLGREVRGRTQGAGTHDRALESAAAALYEIAWSSLLGDFADAQESITACRDSFPDFIDAKYARAELANFLALYCLETGELGAPAEEAIAAFEAVGFHPRLTLFHLRHGYVWRAYLRVFQFLRADEAEKVQLRPKVLKALAALEDTSPHPLLRCHLWVVRAWFSVAERQFPKALAECHEAERIALEHECSSVLYEVWRLRAELHELGGRLTAAGEAAAQALVIAQLRQWSHKAAHIRRRFAAASTVSLETVHSQAGAASALEHQETKKQLDALLQVSLASAAAFDPVEQARLVLDELVKTLNADRACLFMANEPDGKLFWKMGRDAQGMDWTTPSGYSSTVIDRVTRGRQALVVNADEAGEISATASIVAHNLRSIVAAPILHKNRLLGAVYLDSRVSRGVFHSSHIDLLTSLANHIAIGFESARAARSELERQALEQDAVLAAAVQSLFLPEAIEETLGHFTIAGVNESAAKTGGDWWWRHRRADGRVSVVLGDATGHGAGAAMVTAAVAGAYRLLCSEMANASVEHHLHALDNTLHDLCRGRFAMTVTCVELDQANDRARFWVTGGPPIALIGLQGTLEMVQSTSSPLGSGTPSVATFERPLSQLRRIVLFTDGAYEFSMASGTPFGLRRLSRAISAGDSVPAQSLVLQLADKLRSARSQKVAEDDITLVAIDVLARG